MSSAQSANNGYNLNSNLYASNNRHRLKLAGLTESGNDAEFPGGKIIPTEYERNRFDLGYGFRSGAHTLQLDYGNNHTGDTGTPALPMDIRYIRGDLYSLGYQFDGGADARVDLSLYGSKLRHSMDNYQLRQPPASPANWRRNKASSDNAGFSLEGTVPDAGGAWLVGADGFSSSHDSDIDNPNNASFFVVNFNSAEREVVGVFIERQQDLGASWKTEFGIRYNRVSMLARQCGLRRVLRKAKDRDVLSKGLAFYDYRAVHRRA